VANVGDPLFGNVKLGAFLCKISLGFFSSQRGKK
jgi:hypothetical protein